MKVNVNDVLYQKLLLLSYIPVSTRPVARQIVLHEECDKKRPCDKKYRLVGFSQRDLQDHDVWGAMFYKCITTDESHSLFSMDLQR